MPKNRKPQILFINPYFHNWCYRLISEKDRIANLNPAIPYLRGFLEEKKIKTSVLNLNKIIINNDKKNNYFSLQIKRLISGKNKDFFDNGSLMADFVCQKKEKIWEAVGRMDFFNEIIKKNILNKQFTHVGISIVSRGQLLFSLKLADFIKKNCKDIKIIFGGIFITENYQELIPLLEQNPVVDFLIMGGGESSIFKLITNISYRFIPNLIYLNNGIYKHSKNINFSESVNDVACPLYESGKIAYIHASRKCYWNKCSFCHHNSNFFTKNYEIRKSEKVIDDIKKIKSKNKKRTKLFIFTDKCLPPYFLNFFSKQIIKNNIKAKFACFLRPEKNLDYDILVTARKAGFTSFDFGLETFSPRLLKMLNKNLEVDSAVKIIEMCGKIKFRLIIVDVMIGLPTQTEKELLSDLYNIVQLVKKYNNIEINVHPFAVFKNSEIYKQPGKFKIKMQEIKKINFIGEFFNQPFKQINADAISSKRAIAIYEKFRINQGLNPKQWSFFKNQFT